MSNFSNSQDHHLSSSRRPPHGPAIQYRSNHATPASLLGAGSCIPHKKSPRSPSHLHWVPSGCLPWVPLGSSGLQFPIVNTLLSIPFSILHNLPRLQALQPFTPYQAQLVAIATEIILLWAWDPSPTEVAAFPKSREVPLQWPVPIWHPSRADTMSATVSFTLFSSSATTNAPLAPAPTTSSAPTNAVTLQSGEILLHSSDVHWDRENGLVLVAAPIISEEKEIDLLDVPDSPSLAWDDHTDDLE
ncbi:hypothetical protein B0H10DRAFT_380517 [Mycena sp. CBHHK59/15]|nr:hypothetical protein B0H10DRAFT_380517 [Mycena sp. CBHHK59/15]